MGKRGYEKNTFEDPATMRRLAACVAGGMHRKTIAERFGVERSAIDRAIAELKQGRENERTTL
jgi:transposase